MEKFYIIRTDYHGEHWLYGMTNTLADALKFVHDEHLQNADTAIEFCRGSFPFDYEVYKTLFAQKKEEAPSEYQSDRAVKGVDTP